MKQYRAAEKITAMLAKQYGSGFTAQAERGCLILHGQSDDWQTVVGAGLLAAKTPAYQRSGFLGLVNDIQFTGAPIPPMHLPEVSDDSLEGDSPDVLVIGGGVIGCAIARELTRWKLDVLLVEKEHDVAMQTSSRNDGMVHPGIDLHKGTNKYKYNMRGNAMYTDICTQLGVDFVRCGQYIAFPKMWTPFLPLISLYWKWLGVPVRTVFQKELRATEPNLQPELSCALFFPTAGAVCPYNLTIAYAENAIQNGARISLDTAVLSMETEDGCIRSVQTNRGRLHPKLVINAAGVFADQVAAMADDRFFSIHPRKGTNSILDKKETGRLVHTIASNISVVLQRGAHTKGGGIVRTAHGNLLIGPDAVETFDREDVSTSRENVRAVFDKQRHTSPALAENQIITYFSGVRAPTYEEDFVLRRGVFTKNILHAAGIQSPGLTAAPAIGAELARLAVKVLSETQAVAENTGFSPLRERIVHTAALPASERNELIRRDPAYGQIVCRCEEVSLGEIRDALHRPLPCDTVDGVKRRVRPGMGRCQGGFCGPLVTQIIAQELGLPLWEVCKSGKGSPLAFAPTKGGDSK